ncbi:hypothetical protein [Bremerella cremea]|uniref:hypothetical protein n=1 Tax=Bremerella cremea TaxID=1031537 RepID=UPI0031E9D578
MSTRTFVLSVPSLDPIREAIASGDQQLVDALVEVTRLELEEEYGEEPDEDEQEEIDEQLEEARESLQEMILCETPPDKEPGEWNYLVTAMIDHLKLEKFWKYPINEDWKHYYIWDPYRAEVEEQIADDAQKLLQYLDEGRPLRGKAIEHDGCVFAWLSLAEVETLLAALEPVDPSKFSDEFFPDFHEQLLGTLRGISKRKHELFLKAH